MGLHSDTYLSQRLEGYSRTGLFLTLGESLFPSAMKGVYEGLATNEAWTVEPLLA